MYMKNLFSFQAQAGSNIQTKRPLKIIIIQKITRPLSKFFSHLYRYIFVFFVNPKKEFKHNPFFEKAKK
ncbi:hypothetical protein DU472_04105 [Campylobacter novaezeelandiae]|nr:hypothetical protein DU472_04105 [Campylobacter novaezeelandiae]